ncbi:hypothetical protein IFM89_031486 [Coptis chinensis]|uniref:Uncharacterized protein n=1 Tax=Coptis chinensis TaxID=261450 RepID=A0A835HIM6_9MAGN|nr:hypothetical protein IFM89_031486 [Coptis chinensis]
MLRKNSKRVSFSPDINDKTEMFHKHKNGSRVGGGKKIRVVVGILSFRLPKASRLSAMNKFLDSLSTKKLLKIALSSSTLLHLSRDPVLFVIVLVINFLMRELKGNACGEAQSPLTRKLDISGHPLFMECWLLLDIYNCTGKTVQGLAICFWPPFPLCSI